MNPPICLSLREYETAKIGGVWDPVRKVIPSDVVSELERLQQSNGCQIFQISRHGIQAQNMVGMIGVGNRAIEILPKVHASSEGARSRLVEMISYAGLLPHLDGGIARLSRSVPCLLDAYMQAYVRQLEIEWRRGRLVGYQRVAENRSYLRGKLVFQEQLRRNRFQPTRFFTIADNFSTATPVARLLKKGLSLCRRFGVAESTRRAAMSLLGEFDEVPDQEFTSHQLQSIQTDRQNARFEPLVELAKCFVQGQVPDRPGAAATFSLLFDMNQVFEKYVAALVRRACPSGMGVQVQVCGYSLVIRGGKRKFRLRPDIAIRERKMIQLLIDTKWKRLDPSKSHEGVSQSDMYQVYAYAREFHCPTVILLYPQVDGLNSKVADYYLNKGEAGDPVIQIRLVDIALPPSRVVCQLRELIDSAL